MSGLTRERMAGGGVARRAGATILALLLGLPVGARADARVYLIDVAGSANTTPYGMNDQGQVVGTYQDASGLHGFLFSGEGAVPFATGTYHPFALGGLVGINNAGTILGLANTAGLGFITRTSWVIKGSRDEKLPIATFAAPSGCNMTPTAINDRGDIVGYVGGDPAACGHIREGFIYSARSYSFFGACSGKTSCSTSPAGINNRGDIVGQYLDPSGFHGFYRRADGQIRTIDVKDPTHFATALNGINDEGQMVGSLTDLSAGLSASPHGSEVVLINGPQTAPVSFAYPGPDGTAKFSAGIRINNRGWILGQYAANPAAAHGFVMVPNGRSGLAATQDAAH